MKAPWAALGLAAASCVHLTPFTPRALSGQTFAIRPGWSMALVLDGSVDGRPALIRLSVEAPLSRVTDGCFETSPEVVARVSTPTESRDGGSARPTAAEDQVVASSVRLGARLLGDVHALREAGNACELTLGSEVLMGFVLEVRPGARTVTFHPEMPATPKLQAEDSVVLELSRDPRTDRPSLAVQLDAAGSPLTLPMGLATGVASVQLSAEAGRMLAGRDVAGMGLALTSLALAPEWALRHVVVSVREGPVAAEAPAPADAAPPSAAALSGVLGADAWGHYRALIDLQGQHLVLFRRPPAVEGGSGPQSWTQLSSDSTAHGTLVRFISWEMLDRGGQVALEPAHVVLKHCRVGLTLGPEDPGASLEVAIPWPGLEKELPDCANELATVPAWTGELAVAPGARPCSGSCLYAQEVASGKTVCACSGRQPSARAAPALPRPAPKPEAPEPADPAQPRAPSH